MPSLITSSAPASNASDSASFFLPHRAAQGTTAVYESRLRRFNAASAAAGSRRASNTAKRGRARSAIDISSSAELRVTTDASCALIHALIWGGRDAPSGAKRIAFGCCKSGCSGGRQSGEGCNTRECVCEQEARHFMTASWVTETGIVLLQCLTTRQRRESLS